MGLLSVDLYPWAAPDGIKVLIFHLSPLVNPGSCRDERPNDGPLPFIRVMRHKGPDDGLTDQGRYSVFTFAATAQDAYDLGVTVKRRMHLLASRFGGQHPVDLPSGRVYADNVKVLEGPEPVEYIQDSIPRKFYCYSLICEVHFRYMAI